MKHAYKTYIKSHADAPDYEYEGEAETFNEFCLQQASAHAEPEFIAEHTVATEVIDNPNFVCSACEVYQSEKIAKGCLLHAWQKSYDDRGWESEADFEIAERDDMEEHRAEQEEERFITSFSE